MSVGERFRAHMKPSTCKQKSSYKLYNAINKYGVDQFYVEVLEANVQYDDLNQKEIEYIAKFDSYHNGYNSTPGGDGRIINKIEDEEELLKLAQSGIDAESLAAKYSVHKTTILRTLHKLGFYYHVDTDKVIKLAKEGKTNKQIADELRCHTGSVSRILDRCNYRKHRVPVNKRDNFDYLNLFNDYSNQMEIGKICDKYDITKSVLNRIRQKYNIPPRKQIYKKRHLECNDYVDSHSRADDELPSEAHCNSGEQTELKR